ncbi:unnamed protein product [Ambrosiozyma monospora]|uniref:Unnamed protein product n=1 Tax=Ambrosiozyma monospora TaxID=43982 RepID=A0ACB5TBC9_AMBMO|nr:unnamed protein product [Ambrosiozyma monospora]
MAAIMACGALEAHIKSRDPKDEASYCSYLSTSMQLLSSVLSDEKKLRENIEPMILTVLLLTSYTAISNLQKWRPHLRAAQELLTNYVPINDHSKQSKRNSYVIAFCRAWFFSMEILAALSSPMGGTLQTDKEFNNMIFDLPNLDFYLKKLHLMRKDGYNLMLGHTTELAVVFQKLVKLVSKMRQSKKEKRAPETTPSDVSELIAGLHKASQFQIISKNGIIPKTHFLHPENGGSVKPPLYFEPLSSEAIIKIALKDGKVEYLCWYDLSFRCAVNAAYVMVFCALCQFPPNHFMVQSLVKETLQSLIFLDSATEINAYELMMFMVPIHIIGSNCIDQEDRDRVINYYRLLDPFGNAGASDFKQNFLARKWKKYDNKTDKDKDQDVYGDFYDVDEDEVQADIISY